MKAARSSAKKAQRKQPVSKKAGSSKKPAPKLKAVKPSKVEPKKEKEAAKKKVLTNPFETLISLWKVKNETFEQALEKLFAEYPCPEKDVEAWKASVIEKIQSQMRKETLSASMMEVLGERFPKDRIHKLASIMSMKPKTAICLNFMKADLNGFGESLVGKDLKVKRSALSPWGFEVAKTEGITQNPAYQRGLYQIHDEASQLIALLINGRPGQRILDLNAGEGQNALAISAMMRNKGSLFVYDPDQKKMKIFKERAARAGIDNFRILTDSQIAEVKSLDAALIAAPSSGSGDLAHHPELKWKFNRDELPRIQKLQAALLREGARKLKLGGYLIYATHSLSKSENELQLDHFIKSTHNSFRIVPASQYLKECVIPYIQNFFNFNWDEKLLTSLLEQDPYIFLSPDTHSTKGTFVGIIQRIRIST